MDGLFTEFFAKMEQMITSPGLLVSVRDWDEAQIALSAGVQILDMKEPSRGPLGRVDNKTALSILRGIEESGCLVKSSLALAELAHKPVVPLPGEFSQLSYLKLGLAGMRHESDWVEKWVRTRERLTCRFPSGELPSGEQGPRWVAVAYVDEEFADAPAIEDVIAAAADTGCAAVLFDTFEKSQGGLLEFLEIERLESLFARIRSLGMMGVAAGKVRKQDVPDLVRAGADVIAVRTAACRSNKRIAGIDALAVQELLESVRSANAG